MNKKRICTDPDNQQYGRQLSKNVFEFKERGVEMTIDLDNYTSEEMKKAYESYGFPEGHLSNWIIAECIFEQDRHLY